MTGKIVLNRRIIPDAHFYEMIIYAPAAAKRAMAGQFIMIKCGGDTALRRPISICVADGPTLRICYEVRGKGTAYMTDMPEGGTLDFIGPIGNGFHYKPNRRALLVGGGIGIYPLISIGVKYKKAVSALLGFRSASLIHYIDVFKSYGIPADVITDDGSSGRRGFVTELLRESLQKGEGDMVYTCGPVQMMAAVAAICEQFGVECEVSMEERMGCGVGACTACVCRTLFTEEGVQRETYKRVCIDGPVFDAREIKWK
ncbi:MAG: dihydroorotate dehydrogenase electron transfer subunit [Eubacteriales bacterium]|nr:dihydroorotate dehydrogenase electron transfer subunit [Eubacteriales bacterium]